MKRFCVVAAVTLSACALLTAELTARMTDAAALVRWRAVAAQMRLALDASPDDAVLMRKLAAALKLLGETDASATLTRRAANLNKLRAPLANPSGAGCVDCARSVGPDVIVGDINEVKRHGESGGITSHTIGMISCNLGDTPVLWEGLTVNHPVIAQNAFRLKDGRFEQVGMSWMKHAFLALPETFCGPCADPGTGSLLGVGCSDPYSAALNAIGSLLGPRSEINPTNGTFPFNHATPVGNSSLRGRIQIHNVDLEPAMNVGARYFLEGQYIAADDAAAGNDLNNCSYREMSVLATGGAFPRLDLALITGVNTVMQQPAILAWRTADPNVAVLNVDIPGDGRMIVAHNVTDNGNGTWHYEYAVYNMNSDRAAQSFMVTVPTSVVVTNIGFHDVDYHSGELIDGTDWVASRDAGLLRWQTDRITVNSNANALRYGTLYNFRFDADAPPTPALAALIPFKLGDPAMAQMTLMTPQPAAPCGQWDFTNDGVINVLDLAQLIGFWNEPFNVFQLAELVGSWGVCP